MERRQTMTLTLCSSCSCVKEASVGLKSCEHSQVHRPQILDAKIFRSKVKRRVEERETEVK